MQFNLTVELRRCCKCELELPTLLNCHHWCIHTYDADVTQLSRLLLTVEPCHQLCNFCLNLQCEVTSWM